MRILSIIKVICDKRLRNNKKTLLRYYDKREWVSIIECIYVDDTVIKSHLIFQGVNIMYVWIEALVSSDSVSAIESEWINNDIELHWLQKMFESQSRTRQQGEYRLLLLDGHASHVTYEIIQFCISNKIILLYLLSHSTHLLQSLNVNIFLPITTYYKSALEVHLHDEVTELKVDKLTFIYLFKIAREKTMSASNILNF